MSSINDLPAYADMDKSELWYALIPELLDTQLRWIVDNGSKLILDDEIKPYFAVAAALLEDAIVVAGNNLQYFSAHALRSILERIALLWSVLPEVELHPTDLVEAFESNDRKKRTTATDSIFDAAIKKDPEIRILHDMLSRYFSHISHLDRVEIKGLNDRDKLLAARANLIPYLLIFDVSHCLTTFIKSLLIAQGVTPSPLTGGRVGQFTPINYIRTATYILCERHSRKNGIQLSTLISNMLDIKGEIGIRDIYRGGMEIHRYGESEDQPRWDKVAWFATFAVGQGADPNQVKVKLIEKASHGEIYEISWPKSFEVTFVAVGIVASHLQTPYPLFDYLSDFVDLIKKN